MYVYLFTYAFIPSAGDIPRTRFGAYPNHMHVTIIVKTTCGKKEKEKKKRKKREKRKGKRKRKTQQHR
jgi:hypothetical protein